MPFRMHIFFRTASAETGFSMRQAQKRRAAVLFKTTARSFEYGRSSRTRRPPIFHYLALLMLFAQQVVDGFHRIKRTQGHFYENCVPVAHRTVPQARKFESLEVFPVLRLVGDKSR